MPRKPYQKPSKSHKFTRPHITCAKAQAQKRAQQLLAAQRAEHMSASPSPPQSPRSPPKNQAPKASESQKILVRASAQVVGGTRFPEIPLFKVGQRSPGSKKVYVMPQNATLEGKKPVWEEEEEEEEEDEKEEKEEVKKEEKEEQMVCESGGKEVPPHSPPHPN
ncbi:hypothetical protein L211DRAFT_890869 [Terfezia boudieri ATCC MYA-4762]|uniref:Uncharacterized protein n=1 Tax=Terfezia boudieri ATCC MYA-4762 TaxID=1051890 RepID=A0A3N4M333_9PEZI|nr:hypothetical protein L211DRAFT_890869 [Terfezia boudieri ATCC MYA-4762]